jgi:hypothetical protein
MSDDSYKDLPLTPQVAAEHITKILADKAKSRVQLVKEVSDFHERLGGKICSDPTSSIKRALNRLVDDNAVERLIAGWYRSEGKRSVEEPQEFDGTSLDGELDSYPEIKLQIQPEEFIGNGDEFVYVYFQEVHRQLARYEHRDCWPCKIGFTQVSLIGRILGQVNKTGMSELPVVGLAIRTEDGRGLEGATHFALDEAGARKEDAPGNEWFHKSPIRIKNWYNAHTSSVAALRASASPTLADTDAIS